MGSRVSWRRGKIWTSGGWRTLLRAGIARDGSTRVIIRIKHGLDRVEEGHEGVRNTKLQRDGQDQTQVESSGGCSTNHHQLETASDSEDLSFTVPIPDDLGLDTLTNILPDASFSKPDPHTVLDAVRNVGFAKATLALIREVASRIALSGDAPLDLRIRLRVGGTSPVPVVLPPSTHAPPQGS